MAVLIPYNWRQVKSLHSPSIDVLITAGKRRHLRETELLLSLDPRADITELRDWLVTNAKDRFRMYGMFNIKSQPWATSSEYIGVVFSFLDIKDAVHFKLRWYGNAPEFHDQA